MRARSHTSRKTLVFGVLASVALTGCNATRTGQPGGTIDPTRPDLNAMVINTTLSQANIREAIRAPTDGRRNAIILARIAEIDLLYNEYETDILQEARSSGFLVSLGGTLAGLAGASASSVAASQNWSLLSGGLSAADAAYDKEFLAEQTMNAIISQMRAERARALGLIYEKMSSPVSRYPMQAALSDLENYRQAGTMATGLVAMNTAAIQQAEVETDTAAEKVQTFTRGRVTSVQRNTAGPSVAPTAPTKTLNERINTLSSDMSSGLISAQRVATFLNTLPISDSRVRAQLQIVADGTKQRTSQPSVRAEDITQIETGAISGILFSTTDIDTIDEAEKALTQ